MECKQRGKLIRSEFHKIILSAGRLMGRNGDVIGVRETKIDLTMMKTHLKWGW